MNNVTSVSCFKHCYPFETVNWSLKMKLTFDSTIIRFISSPFKLALLVTFLGVAVSSSSITLSSIGSLPLQVATIIGMGTGGSSGTGGPANSARLSNPRAAIPDTNGNIYISDTANFAIRKVTSYSQIITTVAGTLGSSSTSASAVGDNGPITSARFSAIHHFWHAANDDLLLPDYDNQQLRRASQNTGIITAIAGIFNGVISGINNGDGGQATSGRLNTPYGVWQDTASNIFVTDDTYNNVRRIDGVTGIITLFAGSLAGSSGSGAAGDGGPPTSTLMNSPRGVWGDSTGRFIYVSTEQSHCVRRIDLDTNIIDRYAGTVNTGGSSGDGGPATSGRLNEPRGISADTLGNLYVAEFNGNRVRKISAVSNILSLVVGSTSSSGSSTGDGGPAALASVNGPSSVYLDTAGSIYIAEVDGDRIRIVYNASSTLAPVAFPTIMPSFVPTVAPTAAPTAPTLSPTIEPSVVPTVGPTAEPSAMPTVGPTIETSAVPTVGTTIESSAAPTVDPTIEPSAVPTVGPTVEPSAVPTVGPTVEPSAVPTVGPTIEPSAVPTVGPTVEPSAVLTVSSTVEPSAVPTVSPTVVPSAIPNMDPTAPSAAPSAAPSEIPTVVPSEVSNVVPSASPSQSPNTTPTTHEAKTPSAFINSSHTYTVSNSHAFAAITSSGGVLAWGSAAYGGDSSTVAHLLVNVTSIVASKNAFSALRGDGAVVAWGSKPQIAGWAASKHEPENCRVVTLVATEQAFATLTEDGAVVAFGAHCCGGSISKDGFSADLTSGVVSIAATAGAFSALKMDGTVFAWGSKFAGGGLSSRSKHILENVVQLSASKSVFCALKSDGTVVTWGGGSRDVVTVAAISGIGYIVGNGGAFVGYQPASGGVVVWGAPTCGGDSTAVNGGGGGGLLSSNVVSVAQTTTAFAALQDNGTVVAWGDRNAGGDASAATAGLVDVATVVGNRAAFAALTTIGSVVVWGDSQSGGSMLLSSMSNVTALLSSDVVSIHHTARAFAALMTDGSVVVWGEAHYGGSVSADVAAQLRSDTRLICANDLAFTATKTDGSVVMWGNKAVVKAQGLQEGVNFSSVVRC